LGSIKAGGDVHVGNNIIRVVKAASVRLLSARLHRADLAKRNYVKYLVERYHEYREADVRFGRTDRFHYSVIFKNIESAFKAPLFSSPKASSMNSWTTCMAGSTTRF